MNYNEELEKMVAPQYLMNSYKLYFLKALLNNVSVEQSDYYGAAEPPVRW